VTTQEFFPQIRGNYPLYRLLLDHLKLTSTHTVHTAAGANNGTEEFTEELTCPQDVELVTYGGTLSERNRGNYRLRVFCRSLDDKKPVYRFDSHGRAHTNHGASLRLPARQIPTPHFHEVGSDGIMIAFRTPFLEVQTNEEQIKQDHQFGANHFCQEAKISGPNGTDQPIQIIGPATLLSTEDPLAGVSFRL
jgi:hypothetical protein